MKWLYYNDQGELTDTFLIEAGGDICGLSVPMGQWHSLECMGMGSVILECKDGAYEPIGPEDILA